MARVVIIDKHPMTIRGLEATLGREGHSVVGIANNGLDGLDITRTLSPDLIIIELDIPKLGGLDVIRRIVARESAAKILVLTSESASLYEHLCVEAGAVGFLSKLDSETAFVDAVDKILDGKTCFAADALRQDSPDGEPGSSVDGLTPREITVLHYLASGYRVKEIAAELAISDRTVSTYKTRLLEKTGAQSLVELLRFATHRGIVKDEHLSITPDDSSDSRFNNLLNQLPFPVCFRSPDARILAANQAYYDYVGARPEQVLGSKLIDLGAVEDEPLAHVRKTFDAAVAACIPYMMVIVIRIRGERKVFRHSGVPIQDEAGQLIGMLCTSIDLGEEQQQIQALQDRISFFVSTQMRRKTYLLQHEQALLSDILAIQEQLSQIAKPGETVSAILERMKESIGLVSDLIRLEAGEVVPAPFFENLNKLTSAALNALPGVGIPKWTLKHSSVPPGGWVDPVRYAALLKVLLLHLQYVGAKEVDVRTNSIEMSPGHVDWEVHLQAQTTQTPGTAPVVYLAVAGELGKLLHGQVDVHDSEGHFEATIHLCVPVTSMP